MHKVERKMVKYTLKILQCEQQNILKYFWLFFNIVHERIKNHSDKVSFSKCISSA